MHIQSQHTCDVVQSYCSIIITFLSFNDSMPPMQILTPTNIKNEICNSNDNGIRSPLEHFQNKCRCKSDCIAQKIQQISHRNWLFCEHACFSLSILLNFFMFYVVYPHSILLHNTYFMAPMQRANDNPNSRHRKSIECKICIKLCIWLYGHIETV